jgi:hypothetical protein
MDMATIPLRTEADYDRALSEIEPCFTNPPPLDTPAATRFNLLAALPEKAPGSRPGAWTLSPELIEETDSLTSHLAAIDYESASNGVACAIRQKPTHHLAYILRFAEALGRDSC